MSATTDEAERLAAELGLLFYQGLEAKPQRNGALAVRQVYWIATRDRSRRFGPNHSTPNRCAGWLVKNAPAIRSELAAPNV